MICDFGLARTLPQLSKFDKKLKYYRKDEYKHNCRSRYDIFKQNMGEMLVKHK